MSNFIIEATQGQARAGILKTAHGDVETPVFMPVGTQATVKSLSPDDLKQAGAQIILGNTYHLNLRPTSELIKNMGGLHKFMGWDGPILTDSGGFQAFSLGAMIADGVKKVGSVNKSSDETPKKSNKTKKGDKPNLVLSKISEKGVEFTSHIDGNKHMLSPERSIDVQLNLGSDICLVLDELLSPEANPKYVKESLEQTHRWEGRSVDHFRKNVRSSINSGALLFGIVQGVYDQGIREQEAKWAAGQDFDGISIGGSCGVSEHWGGEATNWAATKAIYETMGWVCPHLPDNWARHALGIGEVVDFFECIERGIDMFDCVAPTRRARNGSLYICPTSGGTPKNKFTFNIGGSVYKEDSKPIDPNCECYTCLRFSRAYLHHLSAASELLFHRLATIHNVHFMVNLVKTIRGSIIEQDLAKLKTEWLNGD